MAETKAPKTLIDQGEREEPVVEVVIESQSDDGAPSERAGEGQARTGKGERKGYDPSALGAFRSLSGWVTRTFPGREHTFLGALAGLVLAVLIFTLGVWKALFVAALVTIGALIGQYLDGDRRVVRAIGRLFGGGNS